MKGGADSRGVVYTISSMRSMIGGVALAAGTFSLPNEILQSLPATPSSVQRIPAWVTVASEPLLSPGRFSAGGLQGGYLAPTSAAIDAVVVQ
jgi:hypothetical protein